MGLLPQPFVRQDYFLRYGYRYDKEGLVTIPEQQSVIKEIMSKRERGWSLRSIAWLLNERRAPTKRGGRKWYASTVRSVIRTAIKHKER